MIRLLSDKRKIMKIDDFELIKSGSVEAREYQLKIAEDVGEKNAIVVLPTGLGKTAIAALIIASVLKRRGGRALFLAPTRILVQQHKSFLERVMNLPPGTITGLTGEDDVITRSDAWQGRVVCSTPQIALMDWKRRLFDPSKFSIVVIDEVHRAIGNHSYVQMTKLFPSDQAQMVGLTATLPSEGSRIEEIKQALGAETILFRDYESSDVKPFIQRVDAEVRSLYPTPQMKRALNLLKGVLRSKMEVMAREGLISYQAVNRMSFKELLVRRDSILRRGSWNAKFAYSMCAKLFTTIKYLETQSYSSCLSYYERATGDGKRASLMLKREAAVDEAISIIREEVKAGKEHPKLSALLELVRGLGPQDRALIFAGYRDTVDQIHRLLESAGYSSWTLIGKQGESGQNQKEQVRTVEAFRRGKYQVLIATQIGEEGLDISECNIVVFYDNVPSAIRYIQRRGRTGRQSSGRMVMLMVKGTSDEAYYWVVQRKLRIMKNYVSRTQLKPKPKKKPGTLDSYI
jgi:ERCC4-related helicase